MRIVTSICDRCGGIVSGDALERRGRVECPGIDCESVHRFEELSEEDRAALRDRGEDGDGERA